MKKSLLFVLALAAICLMPSCKKEPVPNGGSTEQPTDTIVPSSNDTIIPPGNDSIPQGNIFIYGNTDEMIVTSYDGIAPQYENGQYYYVIDMNNDGIDDIKFMSEDVGSANVDHATVSSVNCLKNYVELSGELYTQELYKHIDTVSIWYYTDPEYPQFDSIQCLAVIETKTCERIDETDIVESITEKLSLNSFDEGDTLQLESFFMSTEVCLKNRSYFYYGSPTGEGTATITYHGHSIMNNCDYFPLDEEKYIGFKFSQNEIERFGWIKIVLENNGYGDHFIRIIETAIQA